MNIKGSIIVIEENKENRLLFQEIISDLELRNTLLCFNTFAEAMLYMAAQKNIPFLLFSNVLQFNEDDRQSSYKKTILRKMKCPCLFYSILFTSSFVIDTYAIPAKSYFITPYSDEKFKETIQTIIEYWSLKHSAEQYKSKWRNKIKTL
ncbi:MULTISPECIES: hypothetical protein [Flavobacterium]|uniref:Response regulator n=1 Tax=Flavobacterium anhuiense TaxID=459526 RepID=A0AAC9D387_9FLAO|nr:MULTISPECIES: hypothetical protein [Flavobacterium]AOC95876.1 hypothetical protein BB050_02781 [Flavobacterium anhuiense]MXO05294.1 hypothetical protein [Flavobacterium sp. HBTb2-11-1]SCY65790.1 hypothetical protein SAMN02927916_2812 [Flavobacterium anhuiense]